MKTKKEIQKIITLLFVLLYSISAYSQDYYWYRGEKIELERDSTKINVTTLIDTDLSMLLKEFGENLEIKKMQTTKNKNLVFNKKCYFKVRMKCR